MNDKILLASICSFILGLFIKKLIEDLINQLGYPRPKVGDTIKIKFSGNEYTITRIKRYKDREPEYVIHKDEKDIFFKRDEFNILKP